MQRKHRPISSAPLKLSKKIDELNRRIYDVLWNSCEKYFKQHCFERVGDSFPQ